MISAEMKEDIAEYLRFFGALSVLALLMVGWQRAYLAEQDLARAQKDPCAWNGWLR